MALLRAGSSEELERVDPPGNLHGARGHAQEVPRPVAGGLSSVWESNCLSALAMDQDAVKDPMRTRLCSERAAWRASRAQSHRRRGIHLPRA